MQKDFHHAVTYVAARAAEFEHSDAEKIAYCAQYVDDALLDHRFSLLHDILPKYGICAA